MTASVSINKAYMGVIQDIVSHAQTYIPKVTIPGIKSRDNRSYTRWPSRCRKMTTIRYMTLGAWGPHLTFKTEAQIPTFYHK
jgi:hypothetical protein